jgi:hypothetical protein
LSISVICLPNEELLDLLSATDYWYIVVLDSHGRKFHVEVEAPPNNETVP